MNKLKNLSVVLLGVLLLVGCAEKEENGNQKVVTSVFATSVTSKVVNSSSRASALNDQNVSDQNSSQPTTSVLLNIGGLVEGLNVKCVEVSEEPTSGSDTTAIISITDENGTFSHRPIDKCTFSLSPEFVNWLWKATVEESTVMTIQELTPKSYVNTLRLLYSLDEDHNKSNGIKLAYGLTGINAEKVDFEERYTLWNEYNNYNQPLVSKEYVLGTKYNTVTGVVEDTLYMLSDGSSYQFHNNGALTYIRSDAVISDDVWVPHKGIVGGVWSEADGVITVRFIRDNKTFQLKPQSLPLNQGTVIHNVDTNEDVTVTEIETL